MSEQAQIDALEFARGGQRLAGELCLAAMPRLADMLFEPTGKIDYVVAGGLDRRGRPVLDIEVRGRVPLVCQRCLDRMDYVLDRRSRLIVVQSERELPDVAQEDLAAETIPAAEVANVADTIEQEILLGLPLAPMHADLSCVAAATGAGAGLVSPFAVLESLKRP